MELPATICESCNSVSVDTQPIRLMHLRQILGFLIFIMAVVWPVLDLWSPQFSIWLSESYGIKIPIFVRLVMAVLGGGIAAAIATTHHRFRKVAFFCGLIGGLASFGLAWYGLREFAELRGENIISNALFLVALLGMAPAWGLYILLKSRDRQLNPIAEADDTA